MRQVLAGVITFALIACGGGSGSSSSTRGNTTVDQTPCISNPCIITLSGAVTATLTIPNISALWDPGSNQTLVTFRSGIPGQNNTYVLGTVAFPGEPHIGTFASTDPGAIGYVESGAPAFGYRASAGGGFMVGGLPSPAGSYTMTLSEVSVSSDPANTSRPVHGTFDATLPAVPGTPVSGTVTLHATF
jgi:hypothetical protein